MTPKFTTPCFVKVTDAEERREVCEKLEEMGYKNYGNPFQIASATKIFTTIDAEYVPYDVPVDDTWIDCGENIPLFFALAEMKEGLSKGQFVSHNNKLCRITGIENSIYNIDYIHFAKEYEIIRATTDEIINHFKI